MNRTEFLKNSFIATGALIAGSSLNTADARPLGSDSKVNLDGKTFHLDYAPHEGMFANHAGSSFLDQIQYMYD